MKMQAAQSTRTISRHQNMGKWWQKPTENTMKSSKDDTSSFTYHSSSTDKSGKQLLEDILC